MNEELTPRERADMRDLVLAGAQRIRPAGSRRARIATGAIALGLIGVVTGGALTTAALFGSDAQPAPAPTATESTPTPAPTPTQTPVPAPTPDSTTPAPPAEGIVPFGGGCANALDEAAVESAAGIDMMLSDYRWRTGANETLGGIDCVWVSDGEYLAATVHLFAYPAALVASSPLDLAAPGCAAGSDPSWVSCTQWRDVDGTWLLVRADGSADRTTQSGVDALFAQAAGRVGDFARGAPATRTAAWWAAPDCAAIAAGVDPAGYGYERVALLEAQSAPVRTDQPEAIVSLMDAAFACELHFTAGSGDASRGEVVRIDVVPGGGASFPSAAGAEFAEPVTVDGAQAAVIAPGLDRYEGSGSVVVVTDGVNMLMVTPDAGRETVDAAPLASAVLALMHP